MKALSKFYFSKAILGGYVGQGFNIGIGYTFCGPNRTSKP